MKKSILALFVMVSLVSFAQIGFAAGAQKYEWHLSGNVMPVPPYGSMDISGSDVASKLIVNQPNGKVLANITGVMNGLLPNTEYTVYLSNGYTPYVFNGWGINGTYTFDFEYLGVHYVHDAVITGSGSTFPVSGGYPVGGPYQYAWSGTGTISGNSITMSIDYTLGALGTHMDMTGTIAPNGSIIGSWSDNYGGVRSGTWSTASGQAIKNYSGSIGWPGLLTPQVQPFTFMTDGSGSGSWHVNLKPASGVTLPLSFSAWVNGGGATVLVSDQVTLTK